MKRPEFIVAVGGAAAWPLSLYAQQSKQAPVLIGWLALVSRESGAHWFAAFKEGLAALGWKEASQVVIQDRWANGQFHRLRPLAEELAAMKPAVIVAFPNVPVAVAAKAAPATPIVLATGADPVAAGFAASLARPGGMITGVTNVVGDITEKHLEFLLKVAPKLRSVGFLADTNIHPSVRAPLIDAAHRSAARFSVEGYFAEAAAPDEIEGAMVRLGKEGSQALVVLASPLLISERRRIINLAQAQRWPEPRATCSRWAPSSPARTSRPWSPPSTTSPAPTPRPPS